MTDSHDIGPTLLAIQIGGPAIAPAIAESDEWRRQVDQAAADLCTLLVEGGGCGRVRVAFNQLEALFSAADAAYEAARRVLAVCANPINPAVPAPVHLLLADRDAMVVADAGGGRRLGESATRMMQRLPADRIFATQSVANRLSGPFRARFSSLEPDALDITRIGSLAPAILGDEPTTMFALPAARQAATGADRALALRWRDRTVTLRQDSPGLTMGRGSDSDVQIESALVSRHHARLDFRHTNFMLTDQSTNGTFVRMENDEEVFLHHEQIVLRGNGVISLGRRTGSGGGKLIYFTVTA